MKQALSASLAALLPLAAAFILAVLLLLALGVDPVRYFALVGERGLFTAVGLQQSLTRCAPQLLIAAGLIIAFRAGIWNLGVDGQFVLGAVAAAAVAPLFVSALPWFLAIGLAAAFAALAGALWALVPALLRAYHGVNEIVTSLMMSFLGLSLANLLVKLVLWDPATTVPQTRTLALEDRLPRLGQSTVSSGFLFAVVAMAGVHFLITRTSIGERLQILGLNVRAAQHAGVQVRPLTVAAFMGSAALAGLAGAIEVLGVAGNVRADWNPAYGLLVIPAVLLARLHGAAAVACVLGLAVLQIGGESAARRTGVPADFTLVVMGLLLLVLAAAEWRPRRGRAAP